MVIFVLAEGFVEGDTDGGGEVEAAPVGEHGDGDETIGPFGVELWGEPSGFRAKDEVRIWGEID